MSKLIPLLVLLLGVTKSIAAENDSLKRPLEIGISFASTQNFRLLTTNAEPYTTISDYVSYRTIYDRTKVGFNAHLFISKNIGNHFNALIGVSLQERGYNRYDVIWMDEDGVMELGRADLNFQMTYFGIPARLEYFYDFKHFTFFTNAGLGLDLMLRNAVEADIRYNTGETETISYARNSRSTAWYTTQSEEKMNATVVNSSVEMGFKIPFKEKFHLRFSANLNYTLTSTFKQHVRENLISAGIRAGLTYQLF